MQMTFDKSVPVWEQLIRSSGRKKVGRKHGHMPGNMASRRLVDGKKKSAVFYRARRQFNAQVRLYWLEKRDEYPASR